MSRYEYRCQCRVVLGRQPPGYTDSLGRFCCTSCGGWITRWFGVFFWGALIGWLLYLVVA